MLSLRRFKRLADCYGAELGRWPGPVRGEAEALLGVSPQARAVLDEARRLDAAIAAASAREDAVHWPPGGTEAALARLRSGVAARIAPATARRPTLHGFGWLTGGRRLWAPSLQGRTVGLALGGGVAIVAGLLIGAAYAPPAAPDNLLSALQPAPLHLLAD